jgi:hypothetical protein
MSLQEEEERQRREAGASAPSGTEPTAPTSEPTPSTSTPAPVPAPGEQTQAPPHPDTGLPSSTSGPISTPGQVPPIVEDVHMEDVPTQGVLGDDDMEEDEEEAMLKAIAMSMEGQGGNEEKKE